MFHFDHSHKHAFLTTLTGGKMGSGLPVLKVMMESAVGKLNRV
jgi:hypothetical protein